MSWTNTTADLQQQVLTSLRETSKFQTDDEGLASAYLSAAEELELWLNTDRAADPFTVWLETHEEELDAYAGKAVAVHLDKGIVASAEIAAFWDGSLRSKMTTLFQNDPKVYITVVPENDEGVVEAKEQQ